jgi:hypothetical protein
VWRRHDEGEEVMKKRKFADGGMFREGMQVPQDVDGASVTPSPSPAMKRPMPKPATAKPTMPKPAMKRPAPKGSGMFREGMQVPQDIDGASAKPYKKGGSVSKRADGIATKGKTKGTQVVMKKGGKC